MFWGGSGRFYLTAAILLFAVESLIALFGSGFLRHTVGDFLVVILIYCIVMVPGWLSRWQAGLMVLALAFGVEIAQGLDLPERLGFERLPGATLIFGSTFSMADLAAYLLGMVTVLLTELGITNNFKEKSTIS